MTKAYTVYYGKHDRSIEDYISPTHMTRGYFDKYYRAVADITAEGLEEVYTEMQADNWSPHGEARELILSLGLSHTSMMISDIVFCHNDGKYYWCSWAGFDEFALTN
jgi:hypothetical protein